MKDRTVTITRPERREALGVAAHLSAFAAGLTDYRILGYLMDSSRENADGCYTVQGAVFYDDTQPEEVQV